MVKEKVKTGVDVVYGSWGVGSWSWSWLFVVLLPYASSLYLLMSL